MDTQPSLKLSKLQRKSLYRWWWKNYTWMDPVYSTSDRPNEFNLERLTHNWIEDNDKRYLVMVPPRDYINKYRTKFVLWAQKRVKANGGWPKEQNRTKVIKEFLARGFIHTSDFEYNHGDGEYPVITLIGDLQWPIQFKLHQDALECSKKFGIPGYTKCPLPK